MQNAVRRRTRLVASVPNHVVQETPDNLVQASPTAAPAAALNKRNTCIHGKGSNVPTVSPWTRTSRAFWLLKAVAVVECWDNTKKTSSFLFRGAAEKNLTFRWPKDNGGRHPVQKQHTEICTQTTEHTKKEILTQLTRFEHVAGPAAGSHPALAAWINPSSHQDMPRKKLIMSSGGGQ